MEGIVSMTRKVLIVTLVLCLSAQAPAGEAETPWQDFDLGEIQVEGVTVRYEKSLEPKPDAIRKALSGFLKKQAEHAAQIDLFRQKSDKIVEQVNTILGSSPSEKQRAEQHKIFSFFLNKSARTISFGPGTTIYLIGKESTKDYLRKGGSLPGFTYNKAEDEANYKFAINRSIKDKEISEEIEIVCPVEGKRARKEFSVFPATIQRLKRASMISGVALHELVKAQCWHIGSDRAILIFARLVMGSPMP